MKADRRSASRGSELKKGRAASVSYFEKGGETGILWGSQAGPDMKKKGQGKRGDLEKGEGQKGR